MKSPEIITAPSTEQTRYALEDQSKMTAAVNYFAWQNRLVTRELGHKVVEVGCGIGNFTRFLLDRDAVYALDFDPSCVERLHARYPNQANLHVQVTEPGHPAFAALRRYRPDSCVCLNVLEHIEDDLGALRSMADVLIPGGVIVLWVPAFPSLYGPVDQNLRHFRRYTRRSMLQVATAAGLQVRKLHYLNCIGFFGWWANARIFQREEQSLLQIKVFDRLVVPWLSRLEEHLRPPFRPIPLRGVAEAMKVSVIIPVYNEFRMFSQVLSRVQAAALPEGCSKEIVVVNDGSTDGTAELITRQANAGSIVAHHVLQNAGKGTAIRTGLAIASGEILIIQDGDLEYDPQDYVRLVSPILQGEADVVYGSRFLGVPLGMALKNRVANWILTAAANLLFHAGLTDEATAYKAFRAATLRQIRLSCRRFEFCPEVTAKLRRLGYPIREVAITYNARKIAEGKKIRARDGVEALWTLLRYRFAPRRRWAKSPDYRYNIGKPRFKRP